jgi:hypothetical protein
MDRKHHGPFCHLGWALSTPCRDENAEATSARRTGCIASIQSPSLGRDPSTAREQKLQTGLQTAATVPGLIRPFVF